MNNTRPAPWEMICGVRKMFAVSVSSLLLALCLNSAQLLAEDSLDDLPEPFYQYQTFYGIHHNGNYYLGVAGSFATLPDTPNSFYLSYYLVIQAIKSSLMSSGYFWKGGLAGDDFRFGAGRGVDCSSYPINIKHPVLKALLSIQTGCLSNNQPAWIVHRTPLMEYTVPGFREQDLSQVYLYQLQDILRRYNLRHLIISPSQKNHSIQVQTCTNQKDSGCLVIDIDSRLRQDQSWQLEEMLVFSYSGKPRTAWQRDNPLNIVSVLGGQYLPQVIESLSCLMEKRRIASNLFQINCDDGRLVRGLRHWRYEKKSSVTLPEPWLYCGEYLRALSLQSSYQQDDNNQQVSPVLVWMKNNQEMNPYYFEPTPLLSVEFEEGAVDKSAHYRNMDFREVSQLFAEVNLAQVLLQFFVTASSMLVDANPSISATGNQAVMPVRNNILPKSLFRLNSLFHSSVVPKKINLASAIELSSGLPYSHPGHQNKKDFHPGVSRGQVVRAAHTPANGRGQLLNYGGHGGHNGVGNNRPPHYPAPFRGPAAIVPSADLKDLLLQLSGFDLYSRGILPVSTVLEAVVDTQRQSSDDLSRLVASLKTILSAKKPALSRLLAQPVDNIFHLLLHGQFIPVDKSHVILLSELLERDLMIFIAFAPGNHGFLHYHRNTAQFTRADLSSLAFKAAPNTLFLAHGRGHGYVKMYWEPSQYSVLPKGEFRIQKTLGHAWSEAMGANPVPHVKNYLLDLTSENYPTITVEFLHYWQNKLARAGLLAYSPGVDGGYNQYLYSKTMLENCEWFWQNNHGWFLQHSIYSHAKDRRIVDDLRTSRSMRMDPSVGQVGGRVFNTLFFVDLVVPLMGNLMGIQKQIIQQLKNSIVLLPFLNRSAKVAVYGGAANRSYLVKHRFGNDLEVAVHHGIASVNDLDVMVSDKQTAQWFVGHLKKQTRQHLPRLSIVERTIEKDGHLHAHILKFCFEWARVFSIDISYSTQRDFFDFSNITPVALQAFNGDDGSIVLPMISLKALLKRSIVESSLNGGDHNGDHRKNIARQRLALFAQGDDTVKELLAGLKPVPGIKPEKLLLPGADEQKSLEPLLDQGKDKIPDTELPVLKPVDLADEPAPEIKIHPGENNSDRKQEPKESLEISSTKVNEPEVPDTKPVDETFSDVTYQQFLGSAQPIKRKQDLLLAGHDRQPLLGWLSFCGESAPLESSPILNYLKLLKELDTRVIENDGKIILFVAHQAIAAHEKSCAWQELLIPEAAWLKARAMEWNIHSGRLLLALYRARYFSQAFSYLVRIMADARGSLFHPASLIKMAAEVRQARYPDFRHYELTGSFPWPELDENYKTIVRLLLANASERKELVKEQGQLVIDNLAQGQFHAGLALVLYHLKAFTFEQQQTLAAILENDFRNYPGSYWLLSHLKPSVLRDIPNLGNAWITHNHLYFFWHVVQSASEESLLQPVVLRQAYQLFSALFDQKTDLIKDYLPQQLMILDDNMYMDPHWIVKNINDLKMGKIKESTPEDFAILSGMFLSLYYHLEKNIQIMPSCLRLNKFRELSRIRAELGLENAAYGDSEDKAQVQTFMQRLRDAWGETGDTGYIRWLLELLKDIRDPSVLSAAQNRSNWVKQ